MIPLHVGSLTDQEPDQALLEEGLVQFEQLVSDQVYPDGPYFLLEKLRDLVPQGVGEEKAAAIRMLDQYPLSQLVEYRLVRLPVHLSGTGSR